MDLVQFFCMGNPLPLKKIWSVFNLYYSKTSRRATKVERTNAHVAPHSAKIHYSLLDTILKQFKLFSLWFILINFTLKIKTYFYNPQQNTQKNVLNTPIINLDLISEVFSKIVDRTQFWSYGRNFDWLRFLLQINLLIGIKIFSIF